MKTIGILSENTTSNEQRAPLTPENILNLCKLTPKTTFVIQPSSNRIFKDYEYKKSNCIVSNKLSDCDIILGIKRPAYEDILPNKTYLFFSHCFKGQINSKPLLKDLKLKNCTLIDYELLTDDNGKRLLGFGKWAGIGGANLALQSITGNNLNSKNSYLEPQALPHPIKILLTGKGSVAQGVTVALKKLNIEQINNQETFNNYQDSCFIQIDYPEMQTSLPLLIKQTNLLIVGHYWDGKRPPLFTISDLKQYQNLKLIADITCDINGSIPSTIRESTLSNPFYYIDKNTGKETTAASDNSIQIMAVPNLPNLLAKEASADFGSKLSSLVIPKLASDKASKLIEKATILKKGKLQPRFAHLL